VAQALHDAATMSAEEKRNRMRLLREIVKEHNVQRWIGSFLHAMPAAEAVGSRGVANDFGSQSTFKHRRDETMPGVALVATALSPRVRPRYEIGRDAKLRVIGRAAGED